MKPTRSDGQCGRGSLPTTTAHFEAAKSELSEMPQTFRFSHSSIQSLLRPDNSTVGGLIIPSFPSCRGRTQQRRLHNRPTQDILLQLYETSWQADTNSEGVPGIASMNPMTHHDIRFELEGNPS